MKCRKLYKTDSNYNLIFFKSKGIKFPRKLYISLSTGTSKTITSTVLLIEFDDTAKTQHKEIMFMDGVFAIIKMKCDIIIDRKNIYNSCIENIQFDRSSASQLLPQNYNCSFIMETDEIKEFDINDKPIYKQYTVYSFSFGLNEGIEVYNFIYKNGDNKLPFKAYACSVKADENYAVQQENVACSLIQRLSVIKGELWYLINYGLPILDKVRNRQIMDSVIINIILNHPEVKNIIYFTSEIKDHVYIYSSRISTIYNQDIEINSAI